MSENQTATFRVLRPQRAHLGGRGKSLESSRSAPPKGKGGSKKGAISNLPSSKLSRDLSLKLSDLGGGRLSALNREREKNKNQESAWRQVGKGGGGQEIKRIS